MAWGRPWPSSKSKGQKEKGYVDLYSIVGKWLCLEAEGKVLANNGNGDVLAAITQGDMFEYMRP